VFILLVLFLDDFPGGRLPTLDLNIWVGEDNVTRYIYHPREGRQNPSRKELKQVNHPPG
jgi:hypothetical protein